jgi:hypothetical protein
MSVGKTLRTSFLRLKHLKILHQKMTPKQGEKKAREGGRTEMGEMQT